MKKLLVAALAAASLSACGIAEDIAKALSTGGKLDAAKVSATGYTLAKNLEDIQALSGGLEGLVPNLDMGNGGAGFAPVAHLAPSLSPATWACAGDYAGAVTKDDTVYTPDQEEESSIITLHYTCATGQQALITAVEAEVTYKDASTGTTRAYELDATETTGGDLSTGLAQIEVRRYFAEDDVRASFSLDAKLDFLGTFEAPNAYSYAKFEVVMRNGTTVTAEIKPDAPLGDGAEFTSGTATRTTVYGEGDLKSTTETAVITAKDTGSYHLVNEYADGTNDDVTITADGEKLTVDAKGHNGFTRTGSYVLATGEYNLVTTFPAGSAIVSVTESGTWHKNATTGTYNRTVVWADGRESVSSVNVTVTDNALSATFTHEDNTKDDVVTDQITGKIDIVKTPVLTTLKIEVSNGDGDKAVLDGAKYADGSAKLHFTLDLVATEVNPDQEGDLTFNPDGSGSGVIKVTDGKNSTTVTVTIAADGSVK